MVIELVRLLHRHNDGYVTLSVGDGDGGLYPRDAIRADKLQSLFPQVAENYLKDAYVSINASYRTWPRSGTEIGHPQHRTETLRYLCACYCDIDCYQRSITGGRAIGMLIDLQKAGAIPPASLFADSGRGVWALWFLKDPEQDTAQRAFPEKIELYVRVNRALGGLIERALSVGVDPVTDAARHVRLPGSLNTKSERTVGWWPQMLVDGSGVPVYELTELAASMRLQDAPRKLVAKREATSGKHPKRARGWAARCHNYLEDFTALMRLRNGGFDKGMRECAALLYAYILKLNGYAIEDAMLQVSIMAARCRPPLPQDSVRKQVKSAYSRRWAFNAFSHDRIARDLAITELEKLGLKHFPVAPQYRAATPVPTTTPQRTAEVRQQRDEALMRIVDERGGIAPSNREMAAILQAHGFQIGAAAVSMDYKRLGVKTARNLQHERAEARRRGNRIQLCIPMN